MGTVNWALQGIVDDGGIRTYVLTFVCLPKYITSSTLCIIHLSKTCSGVPLVSAANLLTGFDFRASDGQLVARSSLCLVENECR